MTGLPPREARARRRRRAAAAAQERGPTQRDSDRRLFLNRLTTDLDRDDFRRHGWASALNASAIFAFWEELVLGLFDEPA